MLHSWSLKLREECVGPVFAGRHQSSFQFLNFDIIVDEFFEWLFGQNHRRSGIAQLLSREKFHSIFRWKIKKKNPNSQIVSMYFNATWRRSRQNKRRRRKWSRILVKIGIFWSHHFLNCNQFWCSTGQTTMCSPWLMFLPCIFESSRSLLCSSTID